jgi:CubicO group peptidase (beta-lactamase class C family)
VEGSIGDGSFTKNADEYIQALNEITTAGKINGHVLVAKNGEVLLSKGYGATDYDTETKITEDTIFLIGSITKPITALAVMQLQEKGALNLSDPVSKYVPDQTEGDEMTIEQLLTHTSGIRSNVNHNFYSYIPKEELIKKIAAEPLQLEPGSSYEYSNAGYSLLAYIIEKASGQSYEEYLWW